MIRSTTVTRWVSGILLATALGMPAAAFADTLAMHGAITTVGGGPAPDGNYILVVSLYTSKDAAKAAWDETQKSVVVKYGRFTVTLGEDKAIPTTLVASNEPLWLGVQVGADAELPRVRVSWGARTLYAKTAGAANGLSCSGCVTNEMLAVAAVHAKNVAFNYAGSDTRGGAALKAALATNADEAKHAAAADEAKHATNADEAKHATNADAAKHAATADQAKHATNADEAKHAATADKSGASDKLLCTGCVALTHLDDGIKAAFLSTAGGKVSGPVIITKGLDLAGSTIKNAALPAVNTGAVPCTVAERGQLVADQKATGLMFCTGSVWKKVKLCSGSCLLAAQVACGAAITDDCGDATGCKGTGTLCGAEEKCSSGKCVSTLGTQDQPAESCSDLYSKVVGVSSGLYWVDPNGGNKNDAFLVWCRMTGDYPGATLAIKRPGSVAGKENHTGDLNLPCTPTTGGYCKLSDVRINALRQTSKHTDAFVALSYKTAGTTPFCRSFAAKSCVWQNGTSAASQCSNSVARDSGQYCARSQTTASYRGIDGHTCANLKYPGVTSPNNPFMIFEHSGGSHYCGGEDTTWNRIELLVH